MIRSRVGVQCEPVDDGRRCIFLLIFVSISSLLLTIWVTAQQGNALYFDHKYELRGNDQLLSSSPQIDATEKGDVYVAWIDKNSTSGDSDIVFSRSNDSGKSFGRLFELRGNDQLLSSSPQIDATEKGDVYVAWIDKNSTSGDSDIVFSRSNDSGKSFGRLFELRGNDQLLSSSPQIDATEKGDVYVAWIDKNSTSGDSDIVFSRSNDSGKSFGRLFELRGNDQLLSSSPQIAATEKGDVYVAWIDKNSTSGDSDIVFSRSNDSGKSFGRLFELRGNDQLLSSSPQIAATEKGDVYVAWIDKNSTSGDSDIVFSRSNDSGKSFGRLFELRGNDQLLSSSPQIAATEKGDVYVAWIDKNSTSGDSNIIFRVSTDKGLKFGPIMKVNKDTKLQLPFSPKIAATGGGNVYVAWSEDSIQFKEFIDNGNVFGETILLSNRPSLAPLQIAATETGNIYVVWIDSKKSASGGTLLYFKRVSEFFEGNS